MHVSTLHFQSPACTPPAGTALGTRLIPVPFHIPHPGSCPDHITKAVLRKSRIIYRLSKTPSLLSLFSRTLHTVLLLAMPSFPKLYPLGFSDEARFLIFLLSLQLPSLSSHHGWAPFLPCVSKPVLRALLLLNMIPSDLTQVHQSNYLLCTTFLEPTTYSSTLEGANCRGHTTAP